jgi:hypothetical protein
MKYDCIWTNWTLCYLDDGDVLKFLNRARMNLRKESTRDPKSKKLKWRTGLMIIKENIETDSQ